MSERFTITLVIDKTVKADEVKNRYGDVESPASTDRIQLTSSAVTVDTVSEIHDRVDALLLAAGVSRSLLPKEYGDVEIGGDRVSARPL